MPHALVADGARLHAASRERLQPSFKPPTAPALPQSPDHVPTVVQLPLTLSHPAAAQAAATPLPVPVPALESLHAPSESSLCDAVDTVSPSEHVPDLLPDRLDFDLATVSVHRCQFDGLEEACVGDLAALQCFQFELDSVSELNGVFHVT